MSLPSTADCGDLLIRNGSLAGAPGGVEIRSVETTTVDPMEALHTPSHDGLRAVPAWNRYYGDHSATVAEPVRSSRYAKLEKPTPIDWLFGLKVWVHPDNELSRALYVSGTYEPNTLVVLNRLLEPGAVFFDIGANVGVFSLAGSRMVGAGGQVYAFEPSRHECERLRRTCS
jgi:hypothetical protein